MLPGRDQAHRALAGDVSVCTHAASFCLLALVWERWDLRGEEDAPSWGMRHGRPSGSHWATSPTALASSKGPFEREPPAPPERPAGSRSGGVRACVCSAVPGSVFFEVLGGLETTALLAQKVLPGGCRSFLLPVHPMSSSPEPPQGSLPSVGPKPETKSRGPGTLFGVAPTPSLEPSRSFGSPAAGAG